MSKSADMGYSLACSQPIRGSVSSGDIALSPPILETWLGSTPSNPGGPERDRNLIIRENTGPPVQINMSEIWEDRDDTKDQASKEQAKILEL